MDPHSTNTREEGNEGKYTNGGRMDMTRDFDRNVTIDRSRVAAAATKQALPEKDNSGRGPSVVSQYVAETITVTNSFNF